MPSHKTSASASASSAHTHSAKRSRLHAFKPHPPPPHPSPTTSKPRSHLTPSLTTKSTIPFLPSDYILLVGEGDFSFAHSLVHHHAFTSLVATSLDSRDVVLEKYPHAGEILKGLEEGGDAGGGRRESGEDGREGSGGGEEAEEEDGEEGEGEEEEGWDEDQAREKTGTAKKQVRVKFGVDATKLSRTKILGRKKTKKRKGPGEPERGFDKIVFNFPHVGGKTKDVNRQVRYNQDLLVQFFTSALPLLAPRGSILITLFEGAPYQLWNIRDLARHVGLRVGRSFRFDAGAYPGYRHARTLGRIGGRGEEGRIEGRKVEEEVRRGWKGEERAARTFIFEKVEGEGMMMKKVGKKKRKRKREGDEDDDDDDDDDSE